MLVWWVRSNSAFRKKSIWEQQQHQPQQRGHGGTLRWRETKASSCRAMQVCAKHWVYNNKPTVIIMCFFSTSVFCFCGHSAAKLQETRNKNKQRKKILQKPLGHFSYRNIEHILKNYKYLQSLVSLRLLCGSGETSGAACRVVELLSAWKCAVCVCGSLLVCFCQRRHVTSAFCWSFNGFESRKSERGRK